MATDERTHIYQDLHRRQLQQEEQLNRHSARRILSIIREYLQPRSVVDVGCGLGTWLAVAREMGVEEIQGIDGPWITEGQMVISAELLKRQDLEKPLSLGRRFDLAISLEVAEHLSASAADCFVDSLTDLSDHVLFSAAIPGQGGHHHVNEQFLPYWMEKFERRNFVILDAVRGRIWDDREVLWWLRQNVVLFVHRSALQSNPRLLAESVIKRPLSVVHPDVYRARMQGVDELRQLRALIDQGGQFEAVRLENGQLHVRRME